MRVATNLFLATLSLGLFAVGCASSPKPQETPRQGLFERWSELDGKRAPQGRGGSSRPEVSAERVSHLKQFTSEWGWPLAQVEVTSHYGKRGKDFHEGIDLRAKVGTPVFASESGVVIYSGRRISGYGKMVILRHPGSGLSTIYAHNSRLLVRVGQKVKRGQKIAISGRSGRATGPHLHFEVRDGVAAIDPHSILPEFSQPVLTQVEEVSPKPAARAKKGKSRAVRVSLKSKQETATP